MLYNTTYFKTDSIFFKKVNEDWGAFSNMSRHAVSVNTLEFKNTEMLYQVMRYTEHPEIQLEIMKQKSPMSVKMISKKNRKLGFSRSCWGDDNLDNFECNDRIKIMEWCIRLKLRDNFRDVSALLLKSKSKNIVEYAPRQNDIFWGAFPVRESTDSFVGMNVLGKLWMDLRVEFNQKLKENKVLELKEVSLPNVDGLKLLGKDLF